MWTEPGLLRALVRCRRQSRCPSLIVVRDHVCAPGRPGDANEEKWCVRTRSFSRHIRTSRLRTFGGHGNGDDRGELLRAVGVIKSYATMLEIPTASMLVRL